MSSMLSADVREQLADLDAALAIFAELERRGKRRAGLALGAQIVDRQRLAGVLRQQRAWDRTCRRATARRSNRWITRLALAGNCGGRADSGFERFSPSRHSPPHCAPASNCKRQRAESHPARRSNLRRAAAGFRSFDWHGKLLLAVHSTVNRYKRIRSTAARPGRIVPTPTAEPRAKTDCLPRTCLPLWGAVSAARNASPNCSS